MKNRQLWIRFGQLLAVASVGMIVSISCGGDNPTGPAPVKDYPVYFFGMGANWETPMYYEYFPGSDRIDSFYLPFIPTNYMSASADGRQLWVSGGDITYVVDLRSKRVIAELPFGKNTIVFSPNNRYAAIMASGLYILETNDFSVIFHDSLWIEQGRFTADSKRFYAINRPDSGYILDLEHGCLVTKKGFGISNVYGGAISPDETKWFLVMNITYDWSFFLVYDLVADSIVFSQSICPNPIHLQISPYGHYVYLTAGGNIFSFCQPSFSFAVYDVNENIIASEVEAPVSIPDFAAPFLPLDQFVVTPDGKYLVGKWFAALPYVLIYDIEKKETKQLLNLGDKEASSLTTQVSPFERRREPCDNLFFGEGPVARGFGRGG